MKIDMKNATITLLDGSGTPKTLEIKVGDGTLTFSTKKNMEYVKDRGLLDTVREGDQEPVDVRFDIVWDFLKSDTGDPITPFEFLTKTGGAAAYVSSSTDPCEPYAVDVVVEHTPPCEDVTAETITFSDFRYESIDGDLKAGTLSVTGKANVVMPTLVRA